MKLQALIDALDEEAIEEALAMSDDQKLCAGGELFEYACSITLAGIHADHPGFTREQALNELRHRIEEVERLEDGE